MRLLAIALLIACSAKPKATVPAPPASGEEPVPVVQPVPEQVAPEQPPAAETLAADTPKTTTGGATFIAPAQWNLVVRGSATILTAPEGDSRIALVDIEAKNADQAIALAWAAYSPEGKRWPVKVTKAGAPKEGWTEVQITDYQTSPNEKRYVTAVALRGAYGWTVAIHDMSDATGEKRGSQARIVMGQLLPKGYERESFAGKKANPLDKARIAELGKFVENAQKLLGVPGVSIGLIQDGKVVFAGGFGVRDIGKPAKVDGDTKYMIASNTKAMTTLMLAKLVDEKKLTWETTASSLLPSFKLGDADTTSKVLVKHLICACTGMPRQDLEWLFEYAKLTPDGVLKTLGTMQPTSKFGELFQYSNPMAAAAGFIGGHVAFPKLELGKAYDDAMRTRVFAPLGMNATTFDFKKAQTGNFAVAHAPDVDGKTKVALGIVNTSVIPVRPTGGAWSTVKDVLKYVQMELDEGKLKGKQHVSKEALLARRAPQVVSGKDTTYGMGLTVNSRYGVTVVHHGGDMIGFHSDMMWLPEHGVGAVVLTNGDPGWLIRGIFRRKLLEVLFDGKPEADTDVSVAAKQWFDELAAERKLLTVPANADEAGKLAAKYTNEAIGEIAVSKAGDATVFDFTEWKSEVASRKNPDGSVSFITTAPGMSGVEFVVGAANGKRSLTLRDAQHEYVFVEK